MVLNNIISVSCPPYMQKHFQFEQILNRLSFKRRRPKLLAGMWQTFSLEIKGISAQVLVKTFLAAPLHAEKFLVYV
jgi:hypothetical protein